MASNKLLIPTTTVEGKDESVLGLRIAALELPQFLNAETPCRCVDVWLKQVIRTYAAIS